MRACPRCQQMCPEGMDSCPNCGESLTMEAVEMLQAVRARRKSLARRNTDELEVLSEQVPAAVGDAGEDCSEDDELPLFPDSEFDSVCSRLTKDALFEQDRGMKQRVFEHLERYLMNYAAICGLTGVLPGFLAGQMIKDLPSEMFMALMIGCPMVFGAISFIMLVLLKNWISESAGVTASAVRREMKRLREQGGEDDD